MRIGEVAQRLGVETHVLRHWEDAGVVRPARDELGHRVYDAELMARLRVVIGCRNAGLSLADIALVLHRGEAGRAAVIRGERERVDAQLRELRQTRRFLDHVLSCRHSLMSRCTDCAAYAEAKRS